MSATQAPAAKPDNLFGVCAALGEDFGFDPLWLRLGLGAALIVDMEATLIAYVVLGAIVLASRLLAPNLKAEAPAAAAAAPASPQAAVTQDVDALELPRAA